MSTGAPPVVRHDMSLNRENLEAEMAHMREVVDAIEQDSQENQDAFASIDLEKGEMDQLITSLQQRVSDESSDLVDVLENFTKGTLTEAHLRNHITSQVQKTSFLEKTTLAMRTQLEQLYSIIEDVGDNLDSQTSSQDVNRKLNDFYLDFSDLIETCDTMTDVVSSNHSELESKINGYIPFIDTAIRKENTNSEKISSGTGSMKHLKAKLSKKITKKNVQEIPEKGDGINSVSAVGKGSLKESVKPTPRITAFIDRSTQADFLIESTDTATGMSRAATPAEIKRPPSTKANLLDTEEDEVAVTTVEEDAQNNIDLVISGSKKVGSLREITKLKHALSSKHNALYSKEASLMEQQRLLDNRTDQMRTIARQVITQEANIQNRLRMLNSIVKRRIYKVLHKAGMDDDGIQTILEHMQDEEDVGGDEEGDMQQFIDEGVREASSRHDGASSTMSVAAGDEEVDPLEILAAADGVFPTVPKVIGDDLPKSISGTPIQTRKKQLRKLGDELRTELAMEAVQPPPTTASLPSLSRGMSPEGASTERLSAGDMIYGEVLFGNENQRSTPGIPPPEIKTHLPFEEMMVIFPPKKVNKGTSCDDLLSSNKKDFQRFSVNGKLEDRASPNSHPGETITDDMHDEEPGFDDELSAVSGNTFRESKLVKREEVDDEDDGHLPIAAASDMSVLITRTYRPKEERNFRQELASHSNPLMLLYEEYFECLPESLRSSLLASATGAFSKSTSIAVISKFFEHLLKPLGGLDASSYVVIKEISLCEEVAHDIIVVKGSASVPKHLLKRNLEQLMEKFGEVASLIAFVDTQLIEYRVIFDRMQSLDISSLPHLDGNCPSFSQALSSFTSASGRVAEAKKRFEILRERCQRYSIVDELKHNSERSDFVENGGINFEDFVQLQDQLEALEKENAELIEENEELNLEVFRVMQEGDRTPASLLFFSILHDPVTVSVIQQLLLQLTNIKGFADGSEHMDFTSLRKRLQVCISCTPSIDRLVKRYLALLKKWNQIRLGMFSARGQIGGSGDASNLCPLCCGDASRLLPGNGAGSASGGNTGGNTVQKAETRQTKKGKHVNGMHSPIRATASQSRSNNRLPKGLADNSTIDMRSMTDTIISATKSESSLPVIGRM